MYLNQSGIHFNSSSGNFSIGIDGNGILQSLKIKDSNYGINSSGEGTFSSIEVNGETLENYIKRVIARWQKYVTSVSTTRTTIDGTTVVTSVTGNKGIPE